ncbi:MAG: hypothetical protein JST38_05185 [Bacteroidetes bacterium]|nr:hypothetical protein [Bacteroidota bacterium]
MAKKVKSANAVKTRTRVVAKRAKRSTVKKAGARKKAGDAPEPPRKLFDAKKWLGVLPELAGDSLTIQRRLRNKW